MQICTVYQPLYTLSTVYYLLHTAHCILRTIYCILRASYCILYITHNVIYTIYYILYAIYYTLYIIYCILYTVYSIYSSAKAGSDSNAVHVKNDIGLLRTSKSNVSGLGRNITHQATIEDALMYVKRQKRENYWRRKCLQTLNCYPAENVDRMAATMVIRPRKDGGSTS